MVDRWETISPSMTSGRLMMKSNRDSSGFTHQSRCRSTIGTVDLIFLKLGSVDSIAGSQPPTLQCSVRGDGGKVSRFSFSGTDCGCVGERRGGRVAGETYLILKLWLCLRLLLWLRSCGFDKGTATATAKDAAVAVTYFSVANTQTLFYKKGRRGSVVAIGKPNHKNGSIHILYSHSQRSKPTIKFSYEKS